jgi:ribonuclease HII
VLASPITVQTRVKADQDCASVSAASVAAKVERDALMGILAADYAEYGWDSNKGYGSAAHMEAIATIGITPHHRASWVKS